FIGGIDHFLIAQGAARLAHRGAAGGRGVVDAIAGREDGVRGHHRALHFQAGMFCLDGGDARRRGGARLGGAHPHAPGVRRITAPFTSRPACSALMAAMRAELTRLIWPAPTPTVWRFFAYTMALDLTNLATFQAKIRSWISCSVGARLVTTFRSASVIMPMSR